MNLKTIIERLKNLFIKERYHNTGLLQDTRSNEDKEKDWFHEERLFFGQPLVFQNEKITTSQFPIENQNSTSSCVAHATALALSSERKSDIGTYYRLSPAFLYRKRSNYPNEGAVPQEMYHTASVYGLPLYASLPTPKTENEMNAVVLTQEMYTEAEIFKGFQYWTIQKPTIDAVANVAQNNAVSICIYATIEEWSKEYPTIINTTLDINSAAVRHCITVLPKSSFTQDGKKYITIQDSAHFGQIALRHLSEDFFNRRVYSAIYWDTVSTIGVGQRPKHTFTQVLTVGSRGPEVVMVQKLLISEGLLPSDCATGYFGGRTLAAVRAFQSKYAEILDGLSGPTRFWGQRCIKKANELCG
jgi:hypothetical protein